MSIKEARSLGWWLLVLAMLPLTDRAVDALFLRYTENLAAVRGRAIRAELDRHPEVRALVIGDSSARYGADAKVLSEALGVPTWNIGSFHGALAGQVTQIEAELRRGRRLDAVIVITTENGMRYPLGQEGREVALFYYLSPHALRFWTELGLLSPDQAAEWSLALLSPSYRDGKNLTNFAIDAFSRPLPQTIKRWSELRARNQKLVEDYETNRGQAKGIGAPGGPAPIEFERFRQAFLDNRSFRWSVHPETQRWFDLLFSLGDAHGFQVFFCFTPRRRDLLVDPRWAPHLGKNMEQWSARMKAEHKSFEITSALPIGMDAKEYYDSADHLNKEGAARFSAELARLIKAKLRTR